MINLKENLIVFSPARESGYPPESSPQRSWLIKGDLVHIDQHHIDETSLYIGRGLCLNEIGKVTNAFKGGKIGEAKCTECLYVQKVVEADRIRRPSR